MMKKKILTIVVKLVCLGILYMIMLIPGYFIVCAFGDYASGKLWNFFFIAPLLTWGAIAAFNEQKENYDDPSYRQEVEARDKERKLRKQIYGNRFQRFKKWTVDQWGITDDTRHDDRPPMPPSMLN